MRSKFERRIQPSLLPTWMFAQSPSVSRMVTLVPSWTVKRSVPERSGEDLALTTPCVMMASLRSVSRWWSDQALSPETSEKSRAIHATWKAVLRNQSSRPNRKMSNPVNAKTNRQTERISHVRSLSPLRTARAQVERKKSCSSILSVILLCAKARLYCASLWWGCRRSARS